MMKEHAKYDHPGNEMISKVGRPFDIVYYVHWWEPGSKRMCRSRSASMNSLLHEGVDSDGGYIEFYTVDEALAFIEEQKTVSYEDDKPSKLKYRQSLVYAVVATLNCTVKIVRPKKTVKKKSDEQ